MTMSPVPLVLAVVGHRDPRPEVLPRLRQALRQDLEQLLAELPHTPLLMLNGLAAGMDSEAAAVFLEVRAQRPGAAGHQLVAALPKLPASYRQDFSPGAERERFEQLLRACDAVLHPGNCPELRGDAPAGQELPSPQCYGQQGVFLVRQAYLLLAFTNGVETMEVGGTSQSVAMQKGEVHPLFASVDEVIAALEPGALIVYDTPRFKNALPPSWSQPLRRCWLQARACDELRDLLAIPQRINRFNRAMTTAATPNLHARTAERLHHGVMTVVVALGSSLSLALMLLSRPWLAMALMVAVVWLAPKLLSRLKQRFVVLRCLSEALMIQMRWCVVGVPLDTADLLQSRMHPSLHWVRSLLRAQRLQWLCLQRQTAHLVTDDDWETTRLWMVNQLQAVERRRHSQGSFESSIRNHRRRDQMRRCLRAYEQALLTPSDDHDRLHRLRCAVEALGLATIDELNDWVSGQMGRDS